ncbi:hypothetical protein CMO96_03070 [Candidatus Woesebacteria bacterium]|nr:hypothetical protein [Candidatus Woesebacteria bacterium]|tara:strand:- start:375 stop:599 length:225 start_codon:yes stop_codon:yes gene_type:complete
MEREQHLVQRAADRVPLISAPLVGGIGMKVRRHKIVSDGPGAGKKWLERRLCYMSAEKANRLSWTKIKRWLQKK